MPEFINPTNAAELTAHMKDCGYDDASIASEIISFGFSGEPTATPTPDSAVVPETPASAVVTTPQTIEG